MTFGLCTWHIKSVASDVNFIAQCYRRSYGDLTDIVAVMKHFLFTPHTCGRAINPGVARSLQIIISRIARRPAGVLNLPAILNSYRIRGRNLSKHNRKSINNNSIWYLNRPVFITRVTCAVHHTQPAYKRDRVHINVSIIDSRRLWYIKSTRAFILRASNKNHSTWNEYILELGENISVALVFVKVERK